MYKIIGADNAEYGPVSAEKLREWIQQGRLNAQTRVRAEASQDWKPLGEFTEFADLLTGTGTLPPIVAAGQTEGAKVSGLAIASLVLGVLGIFTAGLTALVGLGLGIWALVRISRNKGRLSGTGLAIAGTVVSGLFVLMLPILAAMLLPALAQAKAKAQSINCMNNMKQLALGVLMYANDNKDHFPSADHWCDAVGKYVASPNTFLCPAGDPTRRCHYAFNARLSGVDTKEVSSPSQTVLLFEIDGGWNMSGGSELLIRPGRHRGSVGLVFADGHSEIARPPRLRNLKWEP